MHIRNRNLDDLAHLANGFAGLMVGVRQEVGCAARGHLNRMVKSLQQDQDSREEELEALRLMASRAREENDLLRQRVEALEKKLSGRQKKKS